MQAVSLRYSVPFSRSPRAAALEAAFGCQADEHAAVDLSAELVSANEPWTIGAIVGPSGSGKTLVARHAFPDACWVGPKDEKPWPGDRALIDSLGEFSLEQIASALASVGLNTVPSWLRPFALLSQGEQFRARLARALLAAEQTSPAEQVPAEHTEAFPRRTLLVDEFTGPLDRDSARSACRALSRRLRTCEPSPAAVRLVAVTCHDDILPWLDPDWVLDMSCGKLARGRLPRQPIELDIHACHRNLWETFGRHHYLSSSALHSQSRCFAAVWPKENDSMQHAPARPVAFASLLHAIGMQGVKRISRLVVLPQFQGLGIGRRLANWLGEHCRQQGLRLRISTAHPAMLAALQFSRQWRIARRARSRPHGGFARWTRDALLGRMLTTLEYIG